MNANNQSRGPARRRQRGRRRQPRRKRNVGARQQQVIAEIEHVRIPKSICRNAPFPMRQLIHMKYNDTVSILKDAAASFYVREFKVNDIFDPDPLLGGGSVSGYTALNSMYNRNRVISCSALIRLANIEPTATVAAYWIFRDAQPTTIITSQAIAQSAMEVDPATRPVLMGVSSGNPKATIRVPKTRMAAILGDTLEYMGDVSFAASASSSPSNVIWGAVVLYTYTPLTLLTNGVSCVVELDFVVDWYSGQKALDLNRVEVQQRKIDNILREAAPPGFEPVSKPTSRV